MQSARWLSAPENRQVVRWNRADPGLKMGILQDDEDASGRGAFVRGEVMITPHDGGTHTVPLQFDCSLQVSGNPSE